MSDVIDFPCPHCQKSIRTSSRYAGMQGQCPHCSQMVTIQTPANVVPEIQPQAPPPNQASTDANALLAGVIGGAATVLLYVVFWALRETYVGELFTRRGPIPFISTFVTMWGLTILVLKYLTVKREISYAERELDLLPLEAGMQITPKNVGQFVLHLDGMPQPARESILGHRIRGALEHFRSRKSVPEVQAYLSSHAEIDASKVDSGYTLLRAFIWAVPILGFIGTVMGISSAVSGLASSLDTTTEQVANEDPSSDASATETSTGSKMVQAMGLVTQGLATAFDTTFLALVMAIALLFPTESLKRIEYSMLDRIDAFTNESLLRRMSHTEEQGGLMPEMAQLLEPVFRKHQQWLLEWQKQVSDLGNTIGKDFESHLVGVKQQLERVEVSNATQTTEMVQTLSLVMQDMQRAISDLKDVSANVTGDLNSTVRTASELQDSLTDNTASMTALADRWSQLRDPSHEHNGNGALEGAIQSLNASIGRLTDLAQADAVAPRVEPAMAAPRGILGGLFRKG